MLVDKMLNVFVFDADKQHARFIKEMLCNDPFSSLCTCEVVSDEDGLDACLECRRPESFDAAILDLDLDLYGIPVSATDIVRLHFPNRQSTSIIYMTANLSQVPKAFDTHLTYILPKPVNPSILKNAFDRVLENRANAPAKHEFLAIDLRDGIRKIRFSDILWLESDQHKVLIYTARGPFSAAGPMSAITEKLPKSFQRIHRKYVVNMDHVDYCSYNIMMDNGISLPVSRSCYSDAKKAFVQHLKS